MTTENVTVLFTDLVGSTALSSSMTQDEADELRREHFSTLRQAIAEAGGTEVKNLGDGLMIVFAAASAALSCAVAMQQAVEQDNRRRDRAVGLRVGLSGGEVSKEEGADYFGDPVVEAARLCAQCASGQILAADVVRAMAGRRSRHECLPLGELALKGLPDPVETVVVRWEPLDPSDTAMTVPLPGRLVVRPDVGVVGRATELATITDAVKRVASGEGREVLLVSGEAGLGKTTLVAEAARTAFDHGSLLLFGHCEEDLATPYQLFAEALGHYVTHADTVDLRAHVATHGPELARLVPQLASRLPDLPPSKATDTDTQRYLLFAAVVGLLGDVSQAQPVVVVLDDLQWADKASLQLLRHVIAVEQPMRLLVVGTYRDSELSRAHPFVETLAALHRMRGVSRIQLTGLDDTGVLSLMEAAAGHSLDGAAVGLAHAVYRETDGNPFFVSEVLRHLSETGKIYQDASTGRWVADASLDQMALPDSVRVVIGARVGRLGPDAERVLSLAAVIGRDFDLDLLAAAAKISDDVLLDVLDAATAASLVRELTDTPGRYNFAHALIQRTLAEDLGPTRRARAHRQVAEALEELCGDRPGARVGELARHWFSATQPVDLAKTVEYSRQAGDAALAALAPSDALRYYEQALEVAARGGELDPVLAVDLGIGLGTAQRQTGDPAYRETLLDAARRAAQLGDADRLASAALATNRGFYSSWGRVDTEKIDVLERARELLPATHPDRALVLAMLCQELNFGSSLDEKQALADEAIAIAASADDDATMVRVLNAVLHPLGVPWLLDQSLRWSDQALERAERIGDPVLLLWTLQYRACYLPVAGRFDEFHRCMDAAETLAGQLDQPIITWAHTFMEGGRAHIAGDDDHAEELATRAFGIGTECGEPDAPVFYGAALMAIALDRGSYADWLPTMEQLHVDYPDMLNLLGGTGLVYAHAGRTEGALAILERLATADFDFPSEFGWLSAMVGAAGLVIDLGDEATASVLLDRLAAFADLVPFSGISATPPVCHYLGGLAAVLGRDADADAYYARSAELCAQMSAKYFGAETDVAWGSLLLHRDVPGDHDRARELLTRAHAVATEHGYGGVERRAAELLQGLA